MQESLTREVTVNDTSPEAFEGLLVYIHSDHVLPLTLMQTIELAALADLHTLNDLSAQCCELVLTKLTPGNVTKALLSAYRLKLSALAEACQTYGGLILKLLKNIHF